MNRYTISKTVLFVYLAAFLSSIGVLALFGGTAGLVYVFVVGYLLIAFEHPLQLDKSVPALIIGTGMWIIASLFHLPVIDASGTIFTYSTAGEEAYFDGLAHSTLLHHLGKIAEILFFLIGAMTIVEIVDLHKGFSVITNRIKTQQKWKLLIIVGLLSFFLSAILDNLTTTIVLISLLRRIVPDKQERLWFVALVVIAANAGGAWSPIGDVTTTMLWIGKKVSTIELVTSLLIPSIVCFLIPMIILLLKKEFRGTLKVPNTLDFQERMAAERTSKLSSKTMLILGVVGLISVPILKTITHLPPYIGMLMALAIVWLVSEYIKPDEDFTQEQKQMYSATYALSRIEMSSIKFFMGILLAITALESVVVGGGVGMLASAAAWLDVVIPNQEAVILAIGALSAVVDNVPLVAASMGMYSFPMDDRLWHFIAYAAGTGGSMLIIGSAAGVAAMGMEKIDFIWYLKNIAWVAALGFLAGAGVFVLMN
jgi:Na+/H+ antiporter NhaD/arsenite permease-like protein